jgi:hypothetical protein
MATVMVPPSTAAADGAASVAAGLVAAEPVAEPVAAVADAPDVLVAAVAEPAGTAEDGVTAAGVQPERTMTMTAATAMRSRQRPLDALLFVTWMALRVGRRRLGTRGSGVKT